MSIKEIEPLVQEQLAKIKATERLHQNFVLPQLSLSLFFTSLGQSSYRSYKFVLLFLLSYIVSPFIRS